MDIGALTSSVSTSIALARALLEERDRVKVQGIQADLNARLIQVQTQVSEMLGGIIERDTKIRELTDRVRELEAVQSERSRYELAQIGTLQTYAYKLREPSELQDRKSEPSHFLCQPCFDLGKKSVLAVGPYQAHCIVCKSTLATNPRPPVRRVTSPGGSWMR